MRVAIVYNEPEVGSPDSLDVLEEVFLVEEALFALGHEPVKVPFASGLPELLKKIERSAPYLIFNLVEAVQEKTEFHPLAAGLFEAAGYPFTGAGYAALAATTDKRITKAVLEAKDIPTAKWTAYDGEQDGKVKNFDGLDFPVIVKPACEDASIGITDESVIRGKSKKLLAEKLPRIYKELGGKPLLIEQFIDGREFNVSMIEQNGIPRVLPPAEMLFANWPAGKPRIVNYKAKWHPDAFEYVNTVRTFKPENAPIEEIRRICLACWKAFHLSGYARVDMRLDAHNRPYVMEVNANPCIAPFSGFIQAAKFAGLGEKDVVRIMLEAATLRKENRKDIAGENFLNPPPALRKKGNIKKNQAQKEKQSARKTVNKFSFRYEPVPADRQRLKEILSSTGAFYKREVDVAIELLDDRLQKGEKSEYIFLFCEAEEKKRGKGKAGGKVAGYVCYGPITLTKGRFDLYWIAVDASMQGSGIGSALMLEAEKKMAELGCRHIYVETASKKKYAPTRAFYRKNGYAFVALVPEYYAPGDDKLIFMKTLDSARKQ
ncbi:MAG: GNAT family N-acetyltransferase [Nitrospiraceae bacterium]|nr:GNAT family N-acetyltransferase [Nitrospiraceae bacterium]